MSLEKAKKILGRNYTSFERMDEIYAEMKPLIQGGLSAYEAMNICGVTEEEEDDMIYLAAGIALECSVKQDMKRFFAAHLAFLGQKS